MQSAFKEGLLTGRVAFVAGGTSGINLEIARRFARAGASVAVLSRNPEKVAAAAALIGEEGRPSGGYVADVRQYAAVEDALRGAADRVPGILMKTGVWGEWLIPPSS